MSNTKKPKLDDEYVCLYCETSVSESTEICPNPDCGADFTDGENKSKVIDGYSHLEKFATKSFDIWDALGIAGGFIMIISIASGALVINSIGWSQDQLVHGGTRGEINIYGMATGIAIIFQGVIMGLFMLGFSKLGDYVRRIMIQLEKD